MISTGDLMKRARLVPFFKLVVVYFAGAAGGAPSLAAVAAKCAPVLSLLVLVLLQRPAQLQQRRYGARVGCGLALSALGDALLVWPQQLVAGMAAFAAAHVAYIAAFGLRPRRLALALPCFLATAWYLRVLRPAGALRALVPLYGALLAAMWWRALARGRRAAAGASLFLLSDAALGYSLFAGPLPHHQVVVMSTYYLGQLLIALSALEPPLNALEPPLSALQPPL